MHEIKEVRQNYMLYYAIVTAPKKKFSINPQCTCKRDLCVHVSPSHFLIGKSFTFETGYQRKLGNNVTFKCSASTNVILKKRQVNNNYELVRLKKIIATDCRIRLTC